MDALSQQNRKCVTTVTTGRVGKGGLGSGDSEEALTFGKESETIVTSGAFGVPEEIGGIQRTVEFKAISESSRTTPTNEEGYNNRGGFYGGP